MRGDDRRGLNCPRTEGTRCPVSPCLGATEPGACLHLASLQAWRAHTAEDQRSGIISGGPGFAPSTEPVQGRLRVGLWCPCLGLGGAEVWQLALARGVDPEVISWRGAAVIESRGSANPKMERELASIMPVGYGLDAARTLASACDVIVSWAVTDVSSLVSGLEQPPAVVMACHFPGESPWGAGTDALLQGVDRFVAVSELAVESIPRPIRDRVEVIWNAVDPDRLHVRRDRATMRAGWNVPSDVTVVGYIGRLAPEKDPDAMLRLAAELPEPWHAVVVGEGREREALARKVDALGLKRVRLVGGDTAAGDVLGAIDALVVPSHYESFGLTLAEGLWAGVPVLSTRSGLAKLVPGLAREIRAGAEGRELAEALLADRHDSEGTRLRVDRARAFARERLGLERFGRAWTGLLIESAKQGKGGSPCSAWNRVA